MVGNENYESGEKSSGSVCGVRMTTSQCWEMFKRRPTDDWERQVKKRENGFLNTNKRMVILLLL